MAQTGQMAKTASAVPRPPRASNDPPSWPPTNSPSPPPAPLSDLSDKDLPSSADPPDRPLTTPKLTISAKSASDPQNDHCGLLAYMKPRLQPPPKMTPRDPRLPRMVVLHTNGRSSTKLEAGARTPQMTQTGQMAKTASAGPRPPRAPNDPPSWPLTNSASPPPAPLSDLSNKDLPPSPDPPDRPLTTPKLTTSAKSASYPQITPDFYPRPI